MTVTTFQGVLRSGGGDTTKTAFAGSAELVAPFYFLPTAANTTAVQRSASDTRPVILPVGAVVREIMVNAAGTGGTNPTFDMGWIGYTDPTVFDVDDLVAEGDADSGKQLIHWQNATAGAGLGAPLSATQMVKITGGVGASAATGGAISGWIEYFVPTNGEYRT